MTQANTHEVVRERPNTRPHMYNALTTDLQGGLQLQQDGLAQEDLPGFDAEAAHLRLGHLHYLPRATSPYWRGEKDTVSATSTYRWVGFIGSVNKAAPADPNTFRRITRQS